MLDLYRYMVKIRCYIVQEEQSTAIALIEKLRPQLEDGHCHMDLCELDLLLSEAVWSCGKKDLALVSLARALKLQNANQAVWNAKLLELIKEA